MAAITPKHQESGQCAALTPRRNSASAFVLSLDILFAWGGRGWACARFTYRNFVHLNTRRIFLSYISWQRRFSCSSFILRVFGAHAFHCARSAPPSTYNKQRNVFLLQPSSHQPWRCSHLPTNTIHSAFFFLLKRKKMSPSSSGAGPVFVTATLVLARSNESNPPEYL